MQDLKQEIVNFELDKRFIPGLYYYCNRNCGHCDTSTRCSNYMLFNDLWPRINGMEHLEPNLNNDEGVLSAIFKFVYAMQKEFDAPHPVSLTEIERSITAVAKGEKVNKLLTEWFKTIDEPINQLSSRLKNNDFFTLRNNLEELVHLVMMLPKRITLLYSDAPEYRMVNKVALAKTTLLSIRNIKVGVSEITNTLNDYTNLEIELLKLLSDLSLLLEHNFPGSLQYKRPGIDL